MIASEAFGVILCMQVPLECFCQGEVLDFIIFELRVCVLSTAIVALDFIRLCVALVLHLHAFERHPSLWCFAGY